MLRGKSHCQQRNQLMRKARSFLAIFFRKCFPEQFDALARLFGKRLQDRSRCFFVFAGKGRQCREVNLDNRFQMNRQQLVEQFDQLDGRE